MEIDRKPASKNERNIASEMAVIESRQRKISCETGMKLHVC